MGNEERTTTQNILGNPLISGNTLTIPQNKHRHTKRLHRLTIDPQLRTQTGNGGCDHGGGEGGDEGERGDDEGGAPFAAEGPASEGEVGLVFRTGETWVRWVGD